MVKYQVHGSDITSDMEIALRFVGERRATSFSKSSRVNFPDLMDVEEIEEAEYNLLHDINPEITELEPREDIPMGRSKPTWHSILTLSDGRKVGEMGGCAYLLNEDMEVLTPGFAEISASGNGKYIANLGVETYRVRIISEGNTESSDSSAMDMDS